MVMGFDIASNFARTTFARPGPDVVYGLPYLLERGKSSTQECLLGGWVVVLTRMFLNFMVLFFWLLVSVHPEKCVG